MGNYYHLPESVKRAHSDTQENILPTSADTGRREAPGVRKQLRMLRNGEAYGYIDPDELANLAEPAPHVQTALEEVFGDFALDQEGSPRIKCRVHPHFRRWCLYEREYRPEIGVELWRCFYIFQDDPRKGYLPTDLDGDTYLAHFRGRIGDYVEPDKSHFELLEKFNIAKYGYEAVNEHAGQMEERKEKFLEAKEQERTEAFLDEHWFLAWDEANQNAGSGQYMRDSHCRSWEYKSNIRRYKRVYKNGYSIIEKLSREDYELLVRADMNMFAEAWGKVRGLRRNFQPTEVEWREIFRLSGIKPEAPIDVGKRLVYERLKSDFNEAFIERAPDAQEKQERINVLRDIHSLRTMTKE